MEKSGDFIVSGSGWLPCILPLRFRLHFNVNFYFKTSSIQSIKAFTGKMSMLLMTLMQNNQTATLCIAATTGIAQLPHCL